MLEVYNDKSNLLYPFELQHALKIKWLNIWTKEYFSLGFKKKKNDFAAGQKDRKKLPTVVLTNALERCLNGELSIVRHSNELIN